MEKITLDLCTKGLVRAGKLKMLVALLTAIFGSAYVFVRHGVDKVSVVGVVAIFLFVAVLCLWQKNKDQKITADNICIVEDTFIRVEKMRSWSRFSGWQENCTIYFSQHATYSVIMSATTEPEHPSCDYSAVHFSNPGDEFYLLMLRNGEEERILKCFHKRYFELSADDFVLVDSEYRPKAAVK